MCLPCDFSVPLSATPAAIEPRKGASVTDMDPRVRIDVVVLIKLPDTDHAGSEV